MQVRNVLSWVSWSIAQNSSFHRSLNVCSLMLWFIQWLCRWLKYEALNGRMVCEWIIIGCRRKWSFSMFKYYLGMCLEGLQKTVSFIIAIFHQDLKWSLLKQKSEMLWLEPAFLVGCVLVRIWTSPCFQIVGVPVPGMKQILLSWLVPFPPVSL